MALGNLSDPSAVHAAMDECDRVGRSGFLKEHAFGPARRYFLRRNGRLYDSKAIAAVAHGYQFGEPLERHELYGGLASAVPKLRELGFEVVDGNDAARTQRPSLTTGADYSWAELGALFGFEADYLGAAGGMVSRPAFNALLLITHPGGARSIDYDDYWDGDDLIYTGRGKLGHQERTGHNRLVGDNARDLLVFQPSGPRHLQYLGPAACIEEWTAIGADARGNPRRILRFRLGFDERPPALRADAETARRRPDVQRRPRSFDSFRRPAPRAPDRLRRDPSEASALTEKAVQGHHDILARLSSRLRAAGWTQVEEIPAAVDLWARDQTGRRMIFEAKTLRPASELARVRAAVAQLLEYRFLHGERRDELCLVTDHPISDTRARFLSFLGISVIYFDGDRLLSGSQSSHASFGMLLD